MRCNGARQSGTVDRSQQILPFGHRFGVRIFTDKIHVPRRRPSRLVLVSQNVPVMEAAMGQDLGDALDTHSRRHAMQHERRGVQLAEDSIRLLA